MQACLQLPRRSRINGATAANYAEAERNASLFAIAEAQPYKWRDSGKYTEKGTCDEIADAFSCGDKEIRTLDPLLAKQVLYQLSYTPESCRPARS